MRNLILTLSVLFTAYAHADAKISAKDSDGNQYSIELDAQGTPRANGSARTYPTIKDFRSSDDYSFFCVAGGDRDVRQLLKALVSAANGDGDSWAALKAIYKNPRSWAVLAEITDEGGKKLERFSFPNCRQN